MGGELLHCPSISTRFSRIIVTNGVLPKLGSGLIDQSPYVKKVAMQIAEKKAWAQRVWMRRQSFNRSNIFSIRWRCRQGIASCGIGILRDRVEGMRGVMPRSARATRKRLLSWPRSPSSSRADGMEFRVQAAFGSLDTSGVEPPF